MRVLYVALKYDYNRPERGLSFEHYNFFESLQLFTSELIYFDYGTLLSQLGYSAMNRRLVEVARAEKPTVAFFVLTAGEIAEATIRFISENICNTVNWFCDDHYRFESFTSHWAPFFTYSVTTAASALPKYKKIGYANVIKSQWACNHYTYRKLDLPLRYDVTFVGQPHGNRRDLIEMLRNSGIKVHAWGTGWEAGRLSQEEMIEVFNSSRINLNFSNASVAPPSLRLHIRTAVAKVLRRLRLAETTKRARRGFLALRKPSSISVMHCGGVEYSAQIKGRNFEIPGCGGFMLTAPAEDLSNYFLPDREVALFTTSADLVDRVRYFLAHEDERAEMARLAYERTIAEHTYVERFCHIFDRMGLGRLDSARVGEHHHLAVLREIS